MLLATINWHIKGIFVAQTVKLYIYTYSIYFFVHIMKVNGNYLVINISYFVSHRTKSLILNDMNEIILFLGGLYL